MSNVRPFPAPDEDGTYIDRAVPADLAAEQAVLSACMYDPANLTAVAFLHRIDFYYPAHRLVWDVLQQLAAADKPTNPTAIHAEIEHLGQLHVVRGGDYLFEITNAPSTAADYFAGIVFDRARARRADDLAIRIKQGVAAGASGEDIDKVIAQHQAFEQQRTDAADGQGPSHLMAAVLQWDDFFATDFGNVQLLPGRLMAPGQQIALVGDGKAGKSLFTQEWAWRMATGQAFLDGPAQPPIRVTYIDAENGHPEIQDRMRSFGARPDTMGAFTYLSFPPMRPLDTAAGGQDLTAIARATAAELIVIDTVSRFISGEENAADTWLNLYRHSLMPLKAAGIASARLDHFGKDRERGARGNSAKTQDVDHVWELTAQGGGVLALKRTHTRTGIGPDEFTLMRHARKHGDRWAAGGTRHEVMHDGSRAVLVEGSAEWLVDQLERAGVDPTWGNPRVRQWCAENGLRVRKEKIEEAVRTRKANATNWVPPHLPHDLENGGSPNFGESPDETPGQTFPQPVGEPPGNVPAAPSFPRPLPKEGEGGAHRGTQTPPCTHCGHPLQADWAARGYDHHLICQATGDAA